MGGTGLDKLGKGLRFASRHEFNPRAQSLRGAAAAIRPASAPSVYKGRDPMGYSNHIAASGGGSAFAAAASPYRGLEGDSTASRVSRIFGRRAAAELFLRSTASRSTAVLQLLEYRVSLIAHVGRRKSPSAAAAASPAGKRLGLVPCISMIMLPWKHAETCRNMPKHAGVFVIVRTLLRKHTASVETFRNIPVCFHNNNFIETCS